MIQVIITGPPTGTGFIPYVIDWYQRGRHQFVGLSSNPLLDACRKLQQFGLMDDTVVGLFNRGDHRWIERTTVGHGARQMGEFREFPGGPIKRTPDHPAVAKVLNAAPPAKSEGPPPPPNTPPPPPAGTGQVHAAPKKSGHSHPKHHKAKSGARRGQR